MNEMREGPILNESDLLDSLNDPLNDNTDLEDSEDSEDEDLEDEEKLDDDDDVN